MIKYCHDTCKLSFFFHKQFRFSVSICLNGDFWSNFQLLPSHTPNSIGNSWISCPWIHFPQFAHWKPEVFPPKALVFPTNTSGSPPAFAWMVASEAILCFPSSPGLMKWLQEDTTAFERSAWSASFRPNCVAAVTRLALVRRWPHFLRSSLAFVRRWHHFWCQQAGQSDLRTSLTSLLMSTGWPFWCQRVTRYHSSAFLTDAMLCY